MIDLHIHTNYSDGTDSPVEVLRKAERIGLEVISITDHNSCLAYQEFEGLELSRLLRTRLVVGCEFTTFFAGRPIEVLGYGFEYRAVNRFLEAQYGDAAEKKRAALLRDKLIHKVYDVGLHIDLEHIRAIQFSGERVERPIYEELVNHPENRSLLQEEIWDTFGNFYRKGLTNPQSSFYLESADLYPSLETIAELIHKTGGIAFLAHPFQYRLQDTAPFLEHIYASGCLDGIECFHTTCSDRQAAYLIEFAQRHHLLISGGSDYHGLNKTQHELGVGCGNLNISRDILSDWPIDITN